MVRFKHGILDCYGKRSLKIWEKITNKLWTLPKANANTVKIESNDRALIYLTAPNRKFIGSFVISSRFHPPSDEQRELTRKWHPERNVKDVYYGQIEEIAEFDPVPLKSVRDKLRFGFQILA